MDNLPFHTEDVNIATNIFNINEDQTLTDETLGSWDESRQNEVTNESNTLRISGTCRWHDSGTMFNRFKDLPYKYKLTPAQNG